MNKQELEDRLIAFAALIINVASSFEKNYAGNLFQVKLLDQELRQH